MSNPNKNRLRRTMMFLNCQRAGLVKDPFIYKPDCVILDLEDAVAENQKDSARIMLYHTLTDIDYQGVERFVRINALDTPHWKEDIRVAVAGGAEGIRISKCERAQDVRDVEAEIDKAEAEFSREPGRTLIMAALESPRGVLNALEICEASERMMGVALSGGDYRKTMQTKYYPDGMEILGARMHMVMAARAAGVMCFDTVYTNMEDTDGFIRETQLIKQMGFDGKSIINPRQIKLTHDIFAPTEKEIASAEKTLRAIEENAKAGIGVFLLDGKMLDIAFLEEAKRTIALAKASGIYEGDL
ncbi:MAG: aldolase/citrate lyase family protein [Oscillospiraceae bacterium]